MSSKLSFTIVDHSKHFEDIKKDYNVLSAGIFAFAESCLNARDSNSSYELEGFEISRNDDHFETFFAFLMGNLTLKNHTLLWVILI